MHKLGRKMYYLSDIIFKSWFAILVLIQILFFIVRFVAIYKLSEPCPITPSKNLNFCADIMLRVKKIYPFILIGLVSFSISICIAKLNPSMLKNANTGTDNIILYFLITVIQRILTHRLKREKDLNKNLKNYKPSLTEITINGCTIIELLQQKLLKETQLKYN